MSPAERDAIVEAAVAWARACRDHWALVRGTYARTGLPSKPEFQDIMAAADLINKTAWRLQELAKAAIEEEEVSIDH
jgi:hypothetical protein